MKKCFVITPIGSEGSETRQKSDDVLKYIIKPALEEIGYHVERADESSDSGSISKSIIQNILTNDLVIADLTGHNPNVFYELAIRHATGKPFIQIIEKGEKIPFDVFDIRTISYELNLNGVEGAKISIKQFANNLEYSNPISTPISEVSSLLNLSINSENLNASETLINELQRIDESIKMLENKLIGRIDQLGYGSNNGMTIEEKLGMAFLEKMMDNPHKSDDMIKMINKLNQLSK
jgi:hypothetical protein